MKRDRLGDILASEKFLSSVNSMVLGVHDRWFLHEVYKKGGVFNISWIRRMVHDLYRLCLLYDVLKVLSSCYRGHIVQAYVRDKGKPLDKAEFRLSNDYRSDFLSLVSMYYSRRLNSDFVKITMYIGRCNIEFLSFEEARDMGYSVEIYFETMMNKEIPLGFKRLVGDRVNASHAELVKDIINEVEALKGQLYRSEVIDLFRELVGKVRLCSFLHFGYEDASSPRYRVASIFSSVRQLIWDVILSNVSLMGKYRSVYVVNLLEPFMEEILSYVKKKAKVDIVWRGGSFYIISPYLSTEDYGRFYEELTKIVDICLSSLLNYCRQMKLIRKALEDLM
ncbi:MAG: hypothetical protein DRZ82_10055 [Thermoprotei archaeon]|nr:MAG: hypothetical protein DRZ82_10055 [Thermoprotei archaeon]